MIVSPADMPALAALPDACCAQPRPVSLGAQSQLLPGPSPGLGKSGSACQGVARARDYLDEQAAVGVLRLAQLQPRRLVDLHLRCTCLWHSSAARTPGKAGGELAQGELRRTESCLPPPRAALTRSAPRVGRTAVSRWPLDGTVFPKNAHLPCGTLTVRPTGQTAGSAFAQQFTDDRRGSCATAQTHPLLATPAGMYIRTVGALREAQAAQFHVRRSAGRGAGPRPCQRRTAATRASCPPSQAKAQGSGGLRWI
jgi:hypothetical protein